MLLATAISLLALAVVNALTTHIQGSAKDIEWGTCLWPWPETAGPLECAKLTVPLDYTNASDDRVIELDLLRSQAVTGPSKGSILFNPGGPGASGVEFIGLEAAQFHTVLGGQFDLIGFDPRGTGRTLTALCNNTLEEDYSKLNKRLRKRDDTGLAGFNVSDYSFADRELLWDELVSFSESCEAEDGDIGEYLGTVFVARDMLQIVDALNEDGLLRYWGFSYGSVLGATFALMFPDRVDRLVFDGIANIYEWWSGEYTETGLDTDAVYNGFISHCIAEPELCPLAADYNTETYLKTAISDLITTINILPLTQATDAGNITLFGVQLKASILGQLYEPRLWTALAIQLKEVFAGNLSSFAPQPLNLSVWNPAITLSNPPICCSDFGLRASNVSELVPLIEKQSAVSAFTEALYFISWQCATWRMHAKERYTGDFVGKTRNPIMLIGNTFDPVTPLRSAHNMSEAFEGSVVLQQDSYGHCSISQPSVCTAKAVRRYFLEGVLPEEGTVCKSDMKPFETTSWSDVLLNGTLDAVIKRDVGDVRLLAAMEALDDSMRKRWP